MTNKKKTYIILTYILISISLITAKEPQSFDSKSDSIIMAYLNGYGIEISANNQVEILKSGHDKFIDLFEEIRKAKHHIHLEYFNFRNDSIANSLFEILKEKVKEGVEVRAIYDAFGNTSNNRPLKNRHIKALKESGIEIVEFDPLSFPWINHVFHRDHRKIVVIDGKVGYTGGMNIADYYINGLPKIGDWRDMHIRINGEAVSYLQDIFLDMWNTSTKQQINGEAYYPYRNHNIVKTDSIKIAIVDRKPRYSPEVIRRAYAKSIESAEEKVQIINPYFTPTRIIKKAIKKAIDNGVKVEIMIPGKSDIKFTPDAVLYTANKLRKKGADIYIFNGGFHHSKIMMVDSLFCTVGSTNFNSRSLRYDYEVNAFIFDEKTTTELIDIFEEDKNQSDLLTREMYMKRGLFKRFVGWFAHLFTPFL